MNSPAFRTCGPRISPYTIRDCELPGKFPEISYRMNRDYHGPTHGWGHDPVNSPGEFSTAVSGHDESHPPFYGGADYPACCELILEIVGRIVECFFLDGTPFWPGRGLVWFGSVSLHSLARLNKTESRSIATSRPSARLRRHPTYRPNVYVVG